MLMSQGQVTASVPVAKECEQIVFLSLIQKQIEQWEAHVNFPGGLGDNYILQWSILFFAVFFFLNVALYVICEHRCKCIDVLNHAGKTICTLNCIIYVRN